MSVSEVLLIVCILVWLIGVIASKIYALNKGVCTNCSCCTGKAICSSSAEADCKSSNANV